MTSKLPPAPERPYVLYIHTATNMGGCEAYRFAIPCQELQARGYVADYATLADVREGARARLAGQAAVGPEAYNLYILPRTAYEGPEAIRMFKAAGKRLVFEVDDDFTNQWRTVLPPEAHEAIWRFIHQHVDAVLVSTPPLAHLMRDAAPTKPVFVCPNTVHWPTWQVRKRKRITIGLTGSPTHAGDWDVLATVLPAVLAEHPEVDLLLMGYIPPYLTDLDALFPGQVQTYEPRPYDAYPEIAGSVHITLCPVDPRDHFNRSKSGIKAIEAMACGAVPICTNFLIYSSVVSEQTGYLVDQTPTAWRAAIEHALQTKAWQTRGQTGRARARRWHNIEQQWHVWRNAYRAIAAI